MPFTEKELMPAPEYSVTVKGGYKTKSTSKTFHKDEDLGNLVQYLYDHLECETHEIKGATNLDAPEWHTRTNHKYVITVTKMIE